MQLTVDLARRAHQSPGRLVDEDGLHERSSSRTADRSGSERRVLPCMGACSPPGTASPSTERGRLGSCPSSPSLVSSSLCFARAREDVERRMMGSRLRRALEAVRGSLQNIPNPRPPFCL